MAYFAELDNNNKVLRVIAVSNSVVSDPAPDNEQDGIDFIHNVLKLDGNWKQTSYNTFIGDSGVSQHRLGGIPMRGCYAGIGHTYDQANDVFIPQGFTYDAVNDVFVAPAVE